MNTTMACTHILNSVGKKIQLQCDAAINGYSATDADAEIIVS